MGSLVPTYTCFPPIYPAHATHQILLPSLLSRGADQDKEMTKNAVGQTKNAFGQTKNAGGQSKNVVGQTKNAVGQTKHAVVSLTLWHPAHALLPSSTQLHLSWSTTCSCRDMPSAQNVGQSSCAASMLMGGGMRPAALVASTAMLGCNVILVYCLRMAHAKKDANTLAP